MTDETQTLLFSVVDDEGNRLEGAFVRFYVKDRLVSEAILQKEGPLSFTISRSVEFVDIEVLFATEHRWTKVSMEEGSVEFHLEVQPGLRSAPTVPQPGLGLAVAGSGGGTQDQNEPPWKAAAVWAAAMAALGAIGVAFLQYGPKSCSPPPPQVVQFRVQVLDYSNRVPIANATVSLADGASHMDDVTDGDGRTKKFLIPQSSHANLVLSVSAGDYESRSFNLDRPVDDQTYTAELKQAVVKKTNQTPHAGFSIIIPGTWTVQGIGDPNNERITNGSFSFAKQSVGSAVMTGHLRIDNMDVRLSGRCEWQGRVAHFVYNAMTAQGGSWQGSADLTAESPGKLSGRFESKRGDDVPIVLVKD